MSEAIIVALITSTVSLIGIVASYIAATKRVQHTIETQQALTQAEIQRMKEDIKEHNHYAKLFAESMPVIKEQIKVANHRIEDLERKEEKK